MIPFPAIIFQHIFFTFFYMQPNISNNNSNGIFYKNKIIFYILCDIFWFCFTIYNSYLFIYMGVYYIVSFKLLRIKMYVKFSCFNWIQKLSLGTHLRRDFCHHDCLFAFTEIIVQIRPERQHKHLLNMHICCVQVGTKMNKLCACPWSSAGNREG